MNDSEKKLNGFESFSKKITALIMLVAITPVMFVTGIVVERYNRSYQAKTISHLEALVQKNARMVDSFLQERLNNISFLVREYSCEELMDPVFLSHRLTNLRDEYGHVFQDMGFVNAEGRQIAYAGSYDLQNAQYAGADWFKQAIAEDRTISDAFLGLRGFPHCIVTVTKTCNQKWVLRATIDFSAFSSMVEQLRIGRTGHAFIINKKGDFQTREPNGYTGIRPGQALADSQESDYLRLTAPLKGGDWLLVVLQKRADAFEDILRTHKIAFGAFFFGLVASVITAIGVPTVILSRLTVNKVSNG